MSTTPEGKIKKKINALLDSYGAALYRDMPVPSGYGKPTLDYVCCYRGMYFAIEAKRPTKEPTTRQEGTIEDMRAAGARVFVVNDDDSLDALAVWLEAAQDGEYP